jgi:hypothetical protein
MLTHGYMLTSPNDLTIHSSQGEVKITVVFVSCVAHNSDFAASNAKADEQKSIVVIKEEQESIMEVPKSEFDSTTVIKIEKEAVAIVIKEEKPNKTLAHQGKSKNGVTK